MLISQLVDVVGPNHCLTDPALRAKYEADWTGRYRGHTLAVVRPGSTDELAEVVRLCHDAGQPIVVQGGNTGMVGGSVPLSGELVVSMAGPGFGDSRGVSGGPIWAEAGVTLGEVQRTAIAVGARFGVDTAARESATVGGMIATNAGGMNVVRFGPMADQVVDAGVVLANGRYVPSLRALDRRDPAGGLLDHLPGSEGTLAIVAHADLRVQAWPANLAVGMIEVSADRLEDVLAGLGALSDLFALELFGGPEVALAAESLGRTPPAGGEWLVLAECRTDGDPLAPLHAACGDLPALVATSPREGGELWLFRESLTEAVARLGIPHKFDVRISHEALNRLRPAVEAAAPRARVFVWGHAFSNRHRHRLANMHVNVVGPVDDEAVFDAIEDLGGSVAAEHGIGTAKRHRAARARTDLAVLRRLKDRLDPNAILNPNVLFPPR
jgi:FAD/FMN-containing dehydrogenase